MKRFLVVLLMSVLLCGTTSASVYAQTNETEDQPIETATLQSCGFPQSAEVLLSYAAEDAVWPEIGQAPLQLVDKIPAGTYRVFADSFDPHTTKNDPTQPYERWQFWAYGEDQSTPIYYSAYTDDLPDDQDRNTSILSQYVTFTEDVTALRYVHWAFSKGLEAAQFGNARFDDLTPEQKALVTWQSVYPDCINFETINPVVCTLNTSIAGRAVKATVSVSNPDELPIEIMMSAGDGTKPVETTDLEHTYATNGEFALSAEVYLAGTKITECTKIVKVSPSGTIVLGATTTTPTTAVLGATTLAETGMNAAGSFLSGIALLLLSVPAFIASLSARKQL